MTAGQMSAIGIGWDVRGWQGSAQAVAVVGWQARTQQLHWLGVSPLFRLSSRVAPDLDALLRPALQDEVALMQVLACPHLALGIDAPLAFPRALGELLAGRGPECAVPQREIDNPYAYRDCERWLHQQYGKKPLSATFDRLGNNATLALSQNLDIVPVINKIDLPSARPDEVRTEIEDVIGIDAPFGWPDAFRAAVADWLTSTAKPASINQSEWLAQWYDDIESRASFGEQPIAVEVRASASATGTPHLLTLDDSYFEWCIEK